MRSETITLSSAPPLHALCNAYEVDGRVSWHPGDARGWASMNCYVLVEDDAALLVDTGLTVHREQVLSQIAELVDPDLPLTVFTLRQGEFDSICNLVPVCRRFNVRWILGLFAEGHEWADFHPDLTYDRRPSFETHAVARNEILELGPSRRLEAFRPALRLLNTYWLYDESTRTLCTSDAFAWTLGDDPEGPWLLCADDDDVSPETIAEQLLANRFWWLAGADTDPIRRSLEAFFETHEVETIAPAYGAILRGAEVVAHHVDMLDGVLAELGARTALVSA